MNRAGMSALRRSDHRRTVFEWEWRTTCQPWYGSCTSELVFRQRQVTAGVVLIRLAGLSSRAKADIVSEVMRDHAAELLHAFTVISPGMVRIRPST